MVVSEFANCYQTTLSFCDRIRGVCKCTGTRCHAAVGFLVAEKDNNSFCQWGRKGVKKKQCNMEGEVTQWDASSVLFTRNQHYGHVYRAHSLSCGWEGDPSIAPTPITFFFFSTLTPNYECFLWEELPKIYETLQGTGKWLSILHFCPSLYFKGRHTTIGKRPWNTRTVINLKLCD